MECCGTALVNRVTVLINVTHLQIKIYIDKKTEIITINSKIRENFITKRYIINKKYFIRDKQ